MVKGFANGLSPLELLYERENTYQLLSQTTVDNTSKNYPAYTIDPTTRYPNLNISVKNVQLQLVKHLYDNGHNSIKTNECLGEKDNGCANKNTNSNNNLQFSTLLKWSQMVVQPYGIKVDDLTRSWQNGLAFCAIIHRFKPEFMYANCLFYLKLFLL